MHLDVDYTSRRPMRREEQMISVAVHTGILNQTELIVGTMVGAS